MGQITSVRTAKIPPKIIGFLTWLMIGSGIAGLIFLGHGIVTLYSYGFDIDVVHSLLTGSVLAGTAILAYIGVKKPKDTHVVLITTSAGEISALKDKDPMKIRSVVEAINEAVIDRG
jgi:hypothetical protein